MEETPTTGNFGSDDELGTGSGLGTGSNLGTGSGMGAGSGMGGGASAAGSPGTGGVHSHIGLQPSKGEGDSGKFDLGGMDAGTGGGMASDSTSTTSGVADQAREQASQLADQARTRMGDVREQAGEVLEQARNRVGGLMDQAQDSQPVQMARDNPLPALGIAFALGFLLAGSSDTGGRMGKAKQQIKGAVMGGISAALAQELRNVLGPQGGGLMDSLLGNRGGTQQGGTSTHGSMAHQQTGTPGQS